MKPLRLLLRSGGAVLALLLGGAAAAQSVALTGVLGSKALLVVDGGAPRTAGPGDTVQGVKVVSAAGDLAVVEIGGKRQTLRVGEAPVSVGGKGGSGGGNKIVLPVGSGGHFMTQGSINGRAVQFMVDTGASVVSLSAAEAGRVGLDYRAGQPVRMGTANGVTQGWRVQLGSVRVNDVEVYGVEAVVTPEPMPFVLLGNSFLSRFTMRRDNDLMVLDRRF
ncbi:retropepsin-like aspartic protease family protein [Variovorax terrae]|uniref:TIGR02281 family clan AA aspartic protease n=1 Tax=Variovorax terrae TaxID=2923278 RepID=A0A9X1VSH6_9BURK|nr:TIGR02281 family clan AA aspartic protease [Variovorax terrae]MCJ0762234.1 TIGR02281 family clan AA aspartic protease [Variovorax terrae]